LKQATTAFSPIILTLHILVADTAYKHECYIQCKPIVEPILTQFGGE